MATKLIDCLPSWKPNDHFSLSEKNINLKLFYSNIMLYPKFSS